jgi:hypothetical protein
VSEPEPITFVRGEAMRLYMGRARLADIELARRVYGEGRAESQRKRVRTMRERELTTLGTRGLSAAEEAAALAAAFGFSTAEPLASRVVFALFDKPGRQAAIVAPGDAALSWREKQDAHDAAYLIYRSGLYAKRPQAFPVTRWEMLIHGFRGMRWWFNERDPDFVGEEAIEWLLDLERLFRGQPVTSTTFLAHAPAYLGYLGFLLVRHREIAADPRRLEHEREQAYERVQTVMKLLLEVGEHYRIGATVLGDSAQDAPEPVPEPEIPVPVADA